MLRVYAGILAESARTLDDLELVVRSFSTQMSDASRLELLHEVSGRMDVLYYDMHQFNRQNMLLSLRRARSGSEIGAVRSLYGIQAGD